MTLGRIRYLLAATSPAAWVCAGLGAVVVGIFVACLVVAG